MDTHDTGIQPGRSGQVKLIVILGLMVAIAPLTIDMYLPALPAITTDLHTTAAAVQLTLTGTLAGLALGQLFIGPISDAVGRRAPLITGVGLHILASVLCAFAPNIGTLGALRLLQGLGTAAAAVVATRSSGTSSPARAAKVFSRLMLVIGIAPILAPTLGSQVLRLTRGAASSARSPCWASRSCCWPAGPAGDAAPRAPPQRRGRGTLRDYGALLRDRTFVGLVLVAGFSMWARCSRTCLDRPLCTRTSSGWTRRSSGCSSGLGAIALIAASQMNVRLLGGTSPSRSWPWPWPSAPSPGWRWCSSRRPGSAACPPSSSRCGCARGRRAGPA